MSLEHDIADWDRQSTAFLASIYDRYDIEDGFGERVVRLIENRKPTIADSGNLVAEIWTRTKPKTHQRAGRSDL